MTKSLTIFLFLFLNSLPNWAQIHFGIGAAIHRYDQVLGLKVVKPLDYGSLGIDLGLGVERSLQGVLAPQLAFSFQAPFSQKATLKKATPCYALRYQFDFQNASFLDTYHSFYLGAGLAFGEYKRLSVYLNAGIVMEQMYGVLEPSKSTHFFLNPQAQISYFFGKR
ncbi:MAG: hypothetical protein RLZZ65_817 [Bacteroidota bacterium]|jgi:hypothetical protein